MGVKRRGFLLIKEILYVITISLIGCAGIIFSVLYIDNFNSGFFYEYSVAIKSVSVGIITVLVVFTIIFYKLSKLFVYKLFFLTVTFFTVAIFGLYLLKKSGLLDRIDSVEDLRNYISSKGSYASVLFVAIQFLQVVILPIPGFITVGAGTLLFGALKGALLSVLGIILGSITAFYIGRIFGYKVTRWLVGKDNLDKGLKAIRGKDKIVLTFMFLFPFFPDDVLCFVAGITTMSSSFFIIMILITRVISVFASAFSFSGNLIPYDTWWGILLWILFFALTFILAYFIYKKGEKLESKFLRKKKKRK